MHSWLSIANISSKVFMRLMILFLPDFSQ
jgi:hypothetical protein